MQVLELIPNNIKQPNRMFTPSLNKLLPPLHSQLQLSIEKLYQMLHTPNVYHSSHSKAKFKMTLNLTRYNDASGTINQTSHRTLTVPAESVLYN